MEAISVEGKNEEVNIGPRKVVATSTTLGELALSMSTSQGTQNYLPVPDTDPSFDSVVKFSLEVEIEFPPLSFILSSPSLHSKSLPCR
jgi:hypothetical protein